jgi:hypothetical protein
MTPRNHALIIGFMWVVLLLITAYMNFFSLFALIPAIFLIIFGLSTYTGNYAFTFLSRTPEEEFSDYDFDRTVSIVGASFIVLSYLLLFSALLIYGVFDREFDPLLYIGLLGFIIMSLYFNTNHFKKRVKIA